MTICAVAFHLFRSIPQGHSIAGHAMHQGLTEHLACWAVDALGYPGVASLGLWPCQWLSLVTYKPYLRRAALKNFAAAVGGGRPSPCNRKPTSHCVDDVKGSRIILLRSCFERFNHKFIQLLQLGWPFPPSASFFFTAVFCSAKSFSPGNRCMKLIDTIFCAQLSQFEFPHAYYALLPQPVSATKLTFETTWKMSNFRISFFEKKKVETPRCP